MYNEDDELFCRTMRGVMQNVAHLCGRGKSKTWGKDGWKKVSEWFRRSVWLGENWSIREARSSLRDGGMGSGVRKSKEKGGMRRHGTKTRVMIQV